MRLVDVAPRDHLLRPGGLDAIDFALRGPQREIGGIAILGILVALAMPMVGDWLMNARLRNAAESIQTVGDAVKFIEKSAA